MHSVLAVFVNQPFRHNARLFGRACITAELVVRFDMADSEGICLDIHHHDIAAEADDADVPFADRCKGHRVCSVEPCELDGIESVIVDNRVGAWRQAVHFVDGVRFERAQRLAPTFTATPR